MASFDNTAPRFLRPPDAARLPRNQRRIQVQRLLVVMRNFVVIAALTVGAMWAYRQTQSDARFAVKTIEVEGAVHTPAAAMELVTQQYVGLNLFRIDIGRVQHDLGGLAWVSRIDIEKKLPDTLRIKIAERKPVALVRAGDRLLYIDDDGVAFAELSPAVGDDDLPIITGALGRELKRTVSFVSDLRHRDPQVYSRISEVRPIPPRGFALFDRELGAFVYANADDISAKWRDLYAVLEAEQRPQIAYADLRFNDRLVIKPVESARAAAALAHSKGVNHVQN